jgi:hypothetical protein
MNAMHILFLCLVPLIIYFLVRDSIYESADREERKKELNEVIIPTLKDMKEQPLSPFDADHFVQYGSLPERVRKAVYGYTVKQLIDEEKKI